MKVRINVVQCLVAAGALALAGGAAAQTKGQFAVTVGANQIQPHVESGALSAPALPNTFADVGTATKPIIILNYGLSDHITTEFAISPAYNHSIYGSGAIAGSGELGRVDSLPPTLFVQYRFFEPTATFRPYVGLGVTYAYFFKETGSYKLTALANPGPTPTTFSIDNKWTYSGQLGATLALNDRLFMNVAYMKARLRTDVHFSTGQTQHMKLDPSSTMIGVGYKF